ncbi:MAG: nickel transporter [Pseudomonadota bacterium]
MESSIPQEWSALCALIFVLGMKHGFDADHLATIDGLTRFNSHIRPGMARYCGVLFSLGHGSVVVAIALGVSMVAGHWKVPEWFGMLGAVISIAFLLALGGLNLVAVLRAEPGKVFQPIGLKGQLLGRLQQASHPLLVAMVGALFALSFDTLSQATLFAVTATLFGGWLHALTMALLFLLGMLVTDGINGLWIARLISRTDRLAFVASRVMGGAVAGISLLVAGFGLTKLLSPAIDAWSAGKELAFGAALVAVVVLSFALAIRITWRPAVV